MSNEIIVTLNREQTNLLITVLEKVMVEIARNYREAPVGLDSVHWSKELDKYAALTQTLRNHEFASR